jgi:hypothetical protein
MRSSDVIRYFASTDESPVGVMALRYLQALMKLAPVRLCSMTGALTGKWPGYGALLFTDPGPRMLANVVCCDPSRWTWMIRVAAPPRNFVGPSSDPAAVETPAEILTGRQELYTAGVRNVLIAGAHPRNAAEIETALRYDELIVPTLELHERWLGAGGDPRLVRYPLDEEFLLFAGYVKP